MRRVLLLLLASAACGPAAVEPAGRGADGRPLLRVVSWNVHDLFDEVDRIEPPGELDEVPSPAEVERRLDLVAATLRRLDADVVLLQEVEDLPLLERLAARTGHPEARLLDGQDPRGIDVALLARWPVTAYQGQAGARAPDGRALWPRDAVTARIETGGAGLVLVGTHLSSHLSDPDGARRGVQAAALRALADAAVLGAPGALALVGGDLNDPAEAPALAPLLGDGAWLDPLAALPAAGRWTWSDGQVRQPFDHLLVPAGQAGRVVAAWVDAGQDAAAASDHRPVVLDLAPP